MAVTLAVHRLTAELRQRDGLGYRLSATPRLTSYASSLYERAARIASVRAISLVWIIRASSTPNPGFDSMKSGEQASPMCVQMRAEWSVSLAVPPRLEPMFLERQ